jgi:hypothetical protein
MQLQYNAALGLPTVAPSQTNISKVANCTLRDTEHSLYEGVFCLQNVSPLHTSPNHHTDANENTTTLTVLIFTKFVNFQHDYVRAHLMGNFTKMKY